MFDTFKIKLKRKINGGQQPSFVNPYTSATPNNYHDPFKFKTETAIKPEPKKQEEMITFKTLCFDTVKSDIADFFLHTSLQVKARKQIERQNAELVEQFNRLAYGRK